MQVIWSPAALREISQIYHYIAQFNPHAAIKLAEELFTAGDSLVTFPSRGRPVPGTALRELTVVYPYIIRYRVADDHVRILRVRHGRRRP
ncbi:MAG TPA: type II toxin-antitoxin system RelE/ParE family toxin [Stellaceae bacterium]|nr:type II toxin-antitoxin system RelE/ParE family toxin [Stellaceae bacterium]